MSVVVLVVAVWLLLAVLGWSLLITADRADRESIGRPEPPPLWRWPRR